MLSSTALCSAASSAATCGKTTLTSAWKWGSSLRAVCVGCVCVKGSLIDYQSVWMGGWMDGPIHTDQDDITPPLLPLPSNFPFPSPSTHYKSRREAILVRQRGHSAPPVCFRRLRGCPRVSVSTAENFRTASSAQPLQKRCRHCCFVRWCGVLGGKGGLGFCVFWGVGVGWRFKVCVNNEPPRPGPNPSKGRTRHTCTPF